MRLKKDFIKYEASANSQVKSTNEDHHMLSSISEHPFPRHVSPSVKQKDCNFSVNNHPSFHFPTTNFPSDSKEYNSRMKNEGVHQRNHGGPVPASEGDKACQSPHDSQRDENKEQLDHQQQHYQQQQQQQHLSKSMTDIPASLDNDTIMAQGGKFVSKNIFHGMVGHLEMGALIGQGGFGKVFSGYDTQEKKEVAIKFIDQQVIVQNHLEEYVEREIYCMKTLRHPHVVRLLSVIKSNRGYYLVMELATRGELFDRIVSSKRFNEDTARHFFQQLISAVQYCHSKNICHRDLKAENLLLGGQDELKVCDFGLTRCVTIQLESGATDKQVVFTSLAGSLSYQAPEVIKEEGYQGFSCDIWSCGVILFFMLCGYLPFDARSTAEMHKRILNLQYNKHNRYLGEGVADLIAHILVLDPAERYSCDDIIRHPWFQVNLDTNLFPSDVIAELVSPSMQRIPSKKLIFSVNTPRVSDNCIRQLNGNSIISLDMKQVPVEKMEYRDKLRAAFSSLNVDKTGLLTKSQVKDMLVKVKNGDPVSDADVNAFVSNFDHDEEGRISEEQFILGWTRNKKYIDSNINLVSLMYLFHYDLDIELLQLLHQAFDKIDKGHDGVLTEQDLAAATTTLGLNQGQTRKLHELMDTNKRGKITFENFVYFCTKTDLLKHNSIARSLNRLCELFTVSDSIGYKNFINTGFTISGYTEQIANFLIQKGPLIDTSFERGYIEGFMYATFLPHPRKNNVSSNAAIGMSPVPRDVGNSTPAAGSATTQMSSPRATGPHGGRSVAVGKLGILKSASVAHSDKTTVQRANSPSRSMTPLYTSATNVKPRTAEKDNSTHNNHTQIISPRSTSASSGVAGFDQQVSSISNCISCNSCFASDILSQVIYNSNTTLSYLMAEGKVSCTVGVQLLSAATGYTKLQVYRISGRTEVFHEWFRMLRGLLREEILKCEEDTEPVDDGELM